MFRRHNSWLQPCPTDMGAKQLILLAPHVLLNTLAPAEQARAARALLASMTNDPVLCIIALTWAAHSSVAVVLLVTSVAYSQFVTPAAALALVLGANSAINLLIEGASMGTRRAAGCRSAI